ncbi:MAG: acyl-CoA dehydrogenase family protein [Oscillatoria sp. SIO1A7]|nr:acyl-CoA dehydrogenase family protein [Oscillatoria sp. SIO1A7]
MLSLAQYGTAEALEQYLGDPGNPENVFSFKHSIDLDERDEYPEEICQLLNQWGVYEYYIPVGYGGKLTSFEEMLSIARTIARRDLTVAIAHGCTYLGAVPIWIAGTEKQKKTLAQRIKNREQISFGLTEKDHGSDILSNETKAEPVEGGYLLSGEKWLIGNASRSKALALFARTNPKGGPRGFSLFMVEKEALAPSSYLHLPKIKTHGLRGANISGISLAESFVPAEAPIGSMGSGLELILKAFQITRTLHAGAAPSLGQADTALRVTLNFVFNRKLYGGTVWDIPHARNALVDAFVDILICDCLSIGAARAIHVATEQMSLFSAIVKYFVPTTVDDLIRRLSAILGARYYLREEHCWGIFQKILRDHAIVGVFDGSTAVNLHGINLQLVQLASYRAQINTNEYRKIKESLEVIFSLEKKLPDFDPEKLDLYNRGRDDIVQGIQIALSSLYELKESPEVPADILQHLISLTHKIIKAIDSQQSIISELGSAEAYKLSKSPQLFEMAKNYCALHAASACLHIWLYNRKGLGEFFSRGEWLVLCLHRLMKGLAPSLDSLPEAYTENVAEEIMNLYKQDKLFSIIPFQLAHSEKAS